MNDMTNNIYKSARIRSGLKRDPVAEELDIDVRTLDKYESERKPADEIVVKMCHLYNNPYLAYQHFKQTDLGNFLPDLEEEEFKSATLTMVNNFYEVNDILKSIIKIASDGMVNDYEREEWEKNRKEMMKLVSSLLTLLLTTETKEG